MWWRGALVLSTSGVFLVLHAGSIPPELGKLVALEDLRLTGNELTGKCDLYLFCRRLLLPS